MEARIVTRGEIVIAGMSFFGNPFSQASGWDVDNEIGSLWKRFMAFFAARPDAMGGKATSAGPWYELHAYSPESALDGRYEVFVGFEASRASSPPLSCSLKIIPAGEYAIVTAKGSEIKADWSDRLRKDILEPAGRVVRSEYFYEVYDERFKGMDRLEESELDFCFPVGSSG